MHIKQENVQKPSFSKTQEIQTIHMNIVKENIDHLELGLQKKPSPECQHQNQ